MTRRFIKLTMKYDIPIWLAVDHIISILPPDRYDEKGAQILMVSGKLYMVEEDAEMLAKDIYEADDR